MHTTLILAVPASTGLEKKMGEEENDEQHLLPCLLFPHLLFFHALLIVPYDDACRQGHSNFFPPGFSASTSRR